MSKFSYMFTFKYNSKPLTPAMMDHIKFSVDEIVTTRETAVQYTYVHLKKKAREEDLNRAIQALVSYGVQGSEIYGYHTVDSNTPSESEHIEEHPGFQTLVEHEAQSNREFSRWTANGYNPNANCGYNLLKNKLMAKRAASGQAASGGAGGSAGGMETESDEEEENIPRPVHNGSGKRRRTASDGGGGCGFDSSAVDFMRAMFDTSSGLSEKLLASELKAKHEESKGALIQHQHEFEVYKKENESSKECDRLKAQLGAAEAATMELVKSLAKAGEDAVKKVNIAIQTYCLDIMPN
jgi:hypothetical protein